MLNFLSVDVEEYFQVSAFERLVSVEEWDGYPCRAEEKTRQILELLAAREMRATFFVLGWVARRSPALVRDILNSGHEVASHGYYHRRVTTQTRQTFREDIRQSKALLEDLTGEPIFGYRAPSYSISKDTLWAFDELHAAGYLYDSSVFPVRHDFYGIAEWPRFPFRLRKEGDSVWIPEPEESELRSATFLYEFPITTLSLYGHNLPIAGGGYFRLFPYFFSRWGLRRINIRDGRPFIFYLHPWELDPDQPAMRGLNLKSRVRHYLNLERTERRFSQLLDDFNFCPLLSLLEMQKETASLKNQEDVP